jgi:hypothetical protein
VAKFGMSNQDRTVSLKVCGAYLNITSLKYLYNFLLQPMPWSCPIDFPKCILTPCLILMVVVHTVSTVSLEHSDVPCMFLLTEGSVYINTICYLSQLTIMKPGDSRNCI